MRKPLVIANWKMNPDAPGRAVALARAIERGRGRYHNVEVVIAPPYPFLFPVARVLKRVKLGAQNMFWEDVGPYTGEVSWHQLRHLKVAYVIVGHSERKIHLVENDEMINKKILAALQHSLAPILCVGELERTGNDIPAVVGEQLKNALRGVKKSMVQHLVVAYEPIWAISTMPGSCSDTPENAFSAKLYIRKVLSDILGKRHGVKVRIIYGGSVNAQNIIPFLREGKMEGALVGGGSLHPEEFIQIAAAAGRA